jgi:hypothetical protein
MTLEPTARIVRTSGTLTTTVDKDIIILNMATNNYIALDEVGRRIWDLIETPIQISALCVQLGKEFAGSPEQIRLDVIAFLSELLDESLAHTLEG